MVLDGLVECRIQDSAALGAEMKLELLGALLSSMAGTVPGVEK